MDRQAILKAAYEKGASLPSLTVRAFLLSPTFAFQEDFELGCEITERVAEFFDVSVRAVHVCGSAKLGFSPRTGRAFSPSSDLDLAVIDAQCFIAYLERIISATEQYRDLRGFPDESYNSFAKYAAKGIIRPDFMPFSADRKDWLSFFGRLSLNYADRFSSISAAVYLSDKAFELKQSVALKGYLEAGGAL